MADPLTERDTFERTIRYMLGELLPKPWEGADKLRMQQMRAFRAGVMALAEPMKVACPFCGQTVGDYCRAMTPTDSEEERDAAPVVEPHLLRRAAAERVVEESVGGTR